MDWRSLGTLQITQVGGTVQRLPLPVASPLLRVRGLILDPQQVHYRKIGYLRLLTLAGDEAFSAVLIQQSRIIEVPKWLDLFRVEIQPVPYLVNAQIIIEGLELASVAHFDYVEIPLDIEVL
jgi:hypothetical protein